MGSTTWLLLLVCCGCVTGLQRWLQLPDSDCQGCNQYYDDSAMFMSMLFVSSDTLILGGRNTIHSVDMLSDTHTAYKDAPLQLEAKVEQCMDEGRIEEDCQNYYKVLLMLSETDIMSCGTWGFAPECDVRTVRALEFRERAHVRNGNGFCPANPNEPTSYLKLSGDIGFAGTCTDVCASDQITRFNLQPGSLSSTSHTFNTNDQLSDPKFVYSFEEGDYVYFVFKETASELPTEKIYSRIGRVCKNDVGSSSPFLQNVFTSYFKARFYCTSSQPGHQPFDHDEVDGAVYQERVLYAAFSGPKNLQTGSIVCSYPIAAIDEVFDGPYLTFNKTSREWESEPNRNFNCNTKKEGREAIYLFLMEKGIHNPTPLFNTESSERVNAITADSFTYNSEDIMVLYAASDLGRVHRIAFIRDMDGKVYHTSFQAGDSEVISITYGSGHVYVMGSNWVTSVPIKQECEASSCGECVGAHFPYCGWCSDVTLGKWSCTTKTKCPSTNWVAPTDTCKPLPTFYRTPQNITLGEGATAQFRCASHDAQVTWGKDGLGLPRKAVFLNAESIYIPEVRLEDTGYYECSVNNTSGVVVSRAYLYVQVAAKFRIEPTNVTVTKGNQDLVLTCRAEGLPKPEIWWERTNGDLPDGSEQLPNGDLEIFRVMKADEGGYICFIKNDIGEISQSQSKPAYVTVNDADPYSPAADESSYDSPISITVLTIGIVISAVVCFVIGLTVHMVYRRRKQKSVPDYLDDNHHHGTYSQFGGCPHQDDAGYLCPLPNQNWNNSTWQSYHRHHTGLSSHGAFTPDTAMTNLMTDDEAPPAYSPGQTMSDWYPRTTASMPSSRDYAEIMTVPLRPPPISPPVLPPSALNGHNALNGHMSPLLTNSNSLPISRDYNPGNMPGICFPPANMPVQRDIPVTREMSMATQQEMPVSSGLSTAPATSSSQDGQNLNRLLPGLISDYSTKLQVSSAI